MNEVKASVLRRWPSNKGFYPFAEPPVLRVAATLPKARRVYLSGEEMSLANKEFELLLFMAQNPNIVFSKDTLFDRIWGMDAVGNTATVTVHINRLREKLEKDEDSPQFIETVWGAGYRFKVE